MVARKHLASLEVERLFATSYTPNTFNTSSP